MLVSAINALNTLTLVIIYLERGRIAYGITDAELKRFTHADAKRKVEKKMHANLIG